ncbi:hypothetical protein ABW19_dt0200849 [Dactylella cylindrospora]|nr:hypothetical protein ABW19_dt0200849 [Dactylella cylindrospora]
MISESELLYNLIDRLFSRPPNGFNRRIGIQICNLSRFESEIANERCGTGLDFYWVFHNGAFFLETADRVYLGLSGDTDADFHMHDRVALGGGCRWARRDNLDL